MLKSSAWLKRTTRAPGGGATAAWMCLAVFVCLAGAALGSEESPRSESIADGVTATLNAAADVTLIAPSGRTLLNVLAPRLESHRRHGDPGTTTFFLTTTEGAAGGHRGFSRRADDDGDGRIDEDRADGVDNDGDGAIDEDFAAIGDCMKVVDLRRGGRNLHLETYHWNYAHLRRIFVMSWQTKMVEDDDLLLSLDGASWTATGVGWGGPRQANPGLMNRTMAVTRLSDLAGEYWLGLSVLTTGPTDPILRIQASDLRLRIGAGCDMAVCIAPTLSQLRCSMAVAQRLAGGVHEAAHGRIVPWIVPPPQESDPGAVFTARCVIGAAGSVSLEFITPANWARLPDPETIRLDGKLLNPPASVSWRPANASSPSPVWTERWPDNTVSWQTIALAPHPFFAHRELMESQEASVWTFDYPGGLLDVEADRLELQTMCGRTVVAPLELVPFDAVAADGRNDEHREVPALSPTLLEGFPNPFVDHLSVRFKIPETIGEGFDPRPGDPLYAKASAPIPYASARPRAIVTIYTVSGRTVMTLFDEKCGFGKHETNWNCLDSEGRPMATGTYFCRLQIENWSVTKRVALLR